MKVFFTLRMISKLSEIWVGDQGSEIQDPYKLILDPHTGLRVKTTPDPGFDSDPQHCGLTPFDTHKINKLARRTGKVVYWTITTERFSYAYCPKSSNYSVLDTKVGQK